VPGSVGEYLIQQLYDHGVRHVFGVPGDYVLGFFDQLTRSRLQIVNTCDEQGAGFAADAYARVRGLGVVCVTFSVGGLKVANTTAQAFAERSPVVVISGAPGITEQAGNPLLHHRVRSFDTQKRVFEELTVAQAVLSDPSTACSEIDRVLDACLTSKRPVYIELPRDVVSAQVVSRPTARRPQAKSDPNALREAVDEARERIDAATQPVILGDVEIHRFGLRDELLRLAEKANIPVAATILGKTLIPEDHPLYLGVYEGALGHEAVRQYVESSDCVILLGVLLTDFNLGMNTARIAEEHSINASVDRLTIGYHHFEGVRLRDFLRGLRQREFRERELGEIPHPEPPQPFAPRAATRLTTERLFQALNAFLRRHHVLIADIGEAVFGSIDLYLPGPTEIYYPAYYSSLGFAVPGGIGAQLANPKLRPIVVVGDGAFQMTGMELSTAARFRLNPIVVVLNNGGYGTERPMVDGPFNDLQPWNYSRVGDVLGTGLGFVAQTEDELDTALSAAEKHVESFCIVEARLDPEDRSPALQRLCERLAQRIRKPAEDVGATT
jgi:indolepyruvate decarboxylase